MVKPTSARWPAFGQPLMLFTGPSSQTIAAMAASAAMTPRTTSAHWFSSSGRDWTRASRLESMTMCKIRMRNAHAPTFQAMRSRVASRISTLSRKATRT